MAKDTFDELKQVLISERIIKANCIAANIQDIDKALISSNDCRVVLFDSECFVEESSFKFLFEKFYLSIGSPKHISHVRCTFEGEGRYSISLKKRGKVIGFEWNQESDWVNEKYVDFIILALKSNSGKFIQIDTEDQSMCFVFLKKDYANLYLEELRKSKINTAYYYEQRVENNGCSLLDKLPDNDHQRMVNLFEDTYKVKFDIDCVEKLSVSETLSYSSAPESVEAYFMSLYKDYPLIYKGDVRTCIKVWGRWASNNPEPYMAIITKDLKKVYLCPPSNPGFPVRDLGMPWG